MPAPAPNVPDTYLEPCGRCLVVLNASSYTRCRDLKDNSLPFTMYEGGAGRPAALRLWYFDMVLKYEYPGFEQDAMYDVLTPVATWHGDPVCGMHLIDMRQAEWNDHYPPNRRNR